MEYLSNVANTILIFFILGISLNLVLGYGGLISLAHAVYFGVSSYIVAFFSLSGGLAFIPPMLVALVATTIFAAITAFPALRVRDEYLILLTLAIQLLASGVMSSWISVTHGSSGISGIPPFIFFGHALFLPSQLLPLIAAVAVAVFLVGRRLTGSAYGRVLKALRESESATESLGKNVVQHKVILFGISGFMAALAGALFARSQGFINPASFSLETSILIIAIVALGGAANLYGTFVGAVLVIALPELLSFVNIGSASTISAVRGVAFGLLLIFFSMFRPQGIVPEYSSLLRKRSGRHASDKDKPQIDTHGVIEDAPIERNQNPVLHARNLSKRFGGIVTANDVELALEHGKITALLGPNGAGKTTLFNLLAGTIRADAGEINLHGNSISKMATHRRVKAGIARSFQDVRLFENLSVVDNVRVAIPEQCGENLLNLFFRPLRTHRDDVTVMARAKRYLAEVGLSEVAGELAGDLSYGEQKLLALARLLATGADVLLCDEPAAGVDEQWKRRMLQLLKKLANSGTAVCLVEHNISIVREIADEVYFLDTGAVIAKGSVEEIINNSALSEMYFGDLGATAK